MSKWETLDGDATAQERAEAKRARKAAKRRRDAELTHVGAGMARWAVTCGDEWSRLYFNAYLRAGDRSWPSWAAHLSFARHAAHVFRTHSLGKTRRFSRSGDGSAVVLGEVQP